MELEDISILTNILNFLTWKIIFRSFLVILLLVTIVFVYQVIFPFNKVNFLQEDENVKILTITKSSANKMANINKKLDIVVGIQVVTINFHKNIKIETFADIDVPVIQESYNRFLSGKLYETPLFTSSKINNNHLVKLLSGEWLCFPYKDSSAYNYAPMLDQKYITDVCAVAIPPYNNDIGGILVFYMKDKPSEELKNQLFLAARDISIQIFNDSK